MTTVADAERRTPTFTTIAAITVGNGLEFFDFTVYSFFAVLIGSSFFPAKDPVVSLMLAVGSYGIAFVARPIGGVILGLYADRAGRKPAMTLTLLSMAGGSLGVALAPTYAQIGVFAPIWLVCARLLQGFALGGEVGASTSLLLEYAGDRDRGYYGSWQLFSQGLSALAGAGVAVLLTNALSHDQLYAWGWRIPFAIGVAMVPLGIYIRRHLNETLMPKARNSSNMATLAEVFKANGELVWSCLLLMGGSTITTYVVVFYLPTYATQFLEMPLSVALWAGVTASAVSVATSTYAGILSDRIGRKRTVLWSRFALAISVLPGFMLLEAYRSPAALICVVAALSFLVVLQAVPVFVMITEMFPSRIRATSLSIVFGLGVAVFGGTAQVVATWLISATGSHIAPAWYLIVATLISTIPLLWLTETADKRC
ncbi:MFS transporter [Paraburkholderia susongensis]|uniref:Predicted arabinose efflux permease, MFS family n=1 Tax=Paraburkholderia susongensis TaxID=1515439 RepID=A0A1X7LNW1_9BURK|nr:MFS transporter [Paraburkholderia susongensis]SMG55197.1 Predicted arabinose efflux permease, MFS family [Paraburkholderia susongensis]